MGLFVLFAAALHLACLAAYVSTMHAAGDGICGPCSVTRKHKLFAWVYGLAVLQLLLVYAYDVVADLAWLPPFPWWLSDLANLLWIACVASVKVFTPIETPLVQTTWVLDDVLLKQHSTDAELLRKSLVKKPDTEKELV